jgi:hypothetical protein
MRKLFTFFLAVLLTATVWAQTPQKMSYQAVIRDGSGLLVASKVIGMQINIRQDSPTGTVVYTETQTPTTNANGLISIEIGGEAGFDAINWDASTYFIETKTAVVAPLTTYTITGASQLLSVPYALHAKTAESITGSITESDPVYTASQAVNITANDISNLINLSGNNTGDQDLSGLATTAAVTTSLDTKVDKVEGKGLSTNDFTTAEQTKLSAITGTNTGDQDLSGLTTTAAVTTGLATKVDKVAGKDLVPNGTVAGQMQYWNGTSWVTVAVGMNGQILKYKNGVPTWSDGHINDLSIGDAYQGGIIAYFLVSGDPGYDANVRHGIIAAPSDQSSGIQWFNGSYPTTGAIATALGTGNANTNTIVASQGEGSYAAKLCADLVFGGYDDWYLPSKDELNKLYLNKDNVGGFASGIVMYWSSTEVSAVLALVQFFNNGNPGNGNKDMTNSRVRAIRSF